MARRRTYGVSFSWKRALGVSAAKGRMSRVIGIPLTQSGRQKKLGRMTERTLGPIFGLGFLAMVGGSLGHCTTSGSPPPLTTQIAPPIERAQHALSEIAALSIEELRELQTLLTALGFSPGPVDGVLGSQTQAAILRYETARNLPQIGGADRALLEHLRQEGRLSIR
ncbi:MAG: peptidoglycan-binding protein [Proteobacteria bacterium]|nr:peptidoglycan-binding protein [Pseudomonadota bacterium]